MAVFMTIIIVLLRMKKRFQTQLATYKTTVKYNSASEAECKSASVKVDTRKNISYEPNPAAVGTRKNVAYETNTVTITVQ